MSTYDLIVIGGGPGGYHAAQLAANTGHKTLVIEKHKLGGVCLNEGCIPSKALLHSAKQYTHATHGESYGITAKDVTYNHARVVERKDGIVKTLVSGVTHTLRKAQVEVINGTAKLTGKENDAYLVSVNDTVYLVKKVIIATGSSPIMPPIEGLLDAYEKGTLLTSKEILDLKDIPDKLTIIGGGVIGLEMATYFAQIGSKVTVVEMLPQIGGPIDNDVSSTLKSILEKQDITFILNAKVIKINAKSIRYIQDGEEKTVSHNHALLSVGRKANTKTLGLDNLHIEQQKNGVIVTDNQLKTNIANIYAVGDVNGKSMLAHTAYKEAEVAVNTINGIKDSMNYDVIPSVIYTSPEVISVGFTETKAKEKGYDIKVMKLPVSYAGRHLAETDEHDGFIKLLVDKKKNTLVGAHMISLYASEIALFLSAMLHLEINIEEIKRVIYPHPTVGELVKEALFHI